MMNLIAAALVAATPTPSAPDAHEQHKASHEAMKDCCDRAKDDCAGCCDDMDAKHADHAGQHHADPAQ